MNNMIFDQPFPSEKVVENVLQPYLGNNYKRHNENVFETVPSCRAAAVAANITSIKHIATYTIDDTFPLEIFDVTLNEHSRLAYARVNIQNAIRSLLDTFSIALMFFHYTDDNKDWRISLVKKEASIGKTSNAKRYTYLVGVNHSCHTVRDRFEILKGKDKTVESFMDAFSVEALNNEFFIKYKEQYEKFCKFMQNDSQIRKNFADFLTDGTNKAIRDYVKKMLGRIVFLHFVQKKGWLGGDYNFLKNLFAVCTQKQKDNFLDCVLEPLFFDCLNEKRYGDIFDTKVKGIGNNGEVKIPYLNGGLFEKDLLDEPESKFPAEYFADLLEFFSEYNFTIDENDPDDAEIGVDPEMLGKIFENLLEDNKDKGAFYTPKDIVKFMCKESLVAYLFKHLSEKNNINKELIEKFVYTYQFPDELNKQKEYIKKLLNEVTICDPAIGSGAFPMGILNELFHCRVSLEKIEEAGQVNFVNLKSQIIEHNIYGVDIEKGAVDIARLRFWLALLVDEDTPKALPNLDYKIVMGDSLKGFPDGCVPRGSGKIIDSVLKLKHQYFNETVHTKKKQIKKEIEKLFASEYSIDRTKTLGHNVTFDLKLHFCEVFENGGFDIVIGNPPYFELSKDSQQKDKNGNYIKHNVIYEPYNYKVFTKSSDIYCLFYERGIQILKQNGILCYITSNKWMRNDYGKKLRSYFANNVDILKIIDELNVFDATVTTNILLCRKTNEHTGAMACVMSSTCMENLSDYFNQHASVMKFLNEESWSILSTNENDIMSKMRHIGVSLKDWPINIFRGILTGYNEAFIISEQIKEMLIKEDPRSAEIIRPILIGRDIMRYNHKPSNLWLIVAHNGLRKNNLKPVNIDNYPAIKKHLDCYINDLSKRADKGVTPYNLRNCAYLQDFSKKKIVWGNLNLQASFCMVDSDIFVCAPSNILVPGDEFLLGVLNSKLADFYFRNIGVTRSGGFFEYKPMFIEKMPIPQHCDKSVIKNLVGNITSNNQKEIENLIDKEVYNIYHLTDEEVKIIEEKISYQN